MFKKDWKLYDESEIIHFTRHLCQIEVRIYFLHKIVEKT